MLVRWIYALERKSDRFLYLLIALVLISGSVYSLRLGNSIRFYPDECDYIDLARYLVSTGQFTLDGIQPTAHRPPGMAVFLAVAAVLRGNIFTFHMLNFVALAVAIVCVYKILNEHSTPLAACMGTLLVIGYPLAFYTAGTFYPQTLATALFLISLHIFTRRANKNRDYFIGGLSMGLLILTVPSFVYILFIFTFWLLFHPTGRSVRGWLISIVPVLLLLGSWTARNYRIFHTFFFVSTNSGENLLMGNSEYSTPNAGPMVDISRFRVEAASFNEVERDRYFQTQAIDYMLVHKTHTIQLFFMKAIHYFNFRNDLKTNGVTSNLKELGLMITYIPLLSIFILRLIMSKFYKLSPFEILIASLYLSYALISAVFFPRIRYRLPLDFLLILIAAMFLESFVIQKLRIKNKIMTPDIQ